MKKRFLLSFSLILVMMSFIAVPLQIAHADGNIHGDAHLIFANCSTKLCKQLTLTYNLSGVNPKATTQMIIRIRKDSCDSGNEKFIDQGKLFTKNTKVMKGSIKLPSGKTVPLAARNKDTLLFCLSRGSTLVAQGTFTKGTTEIKKASIAHA